MYLKRYTLASLILMIVTGWFVYAFVTQESVAIDLFGIHFPPMPVALLVLVPVIVLFIASVLHMTYYSIVGSFKRRRYKSDFDKLMASLNDAVVGKEPKHQEYKTERYAMLGKVLEQFKLFAYKELESVGNEKLDKAFEVLENVKSGSVADLGKYHLDTDNALMVQNQINRYNNGDVSPEGVLSKPERYSDSLKRRAFADLIIDAPIHVIDQYKSYMTKESLFTILSRINADEHRLEIANEALIDLFEQVEMDEETYIEAAVTLGAHMLPDQRIKLFEELSEQDDDATAAYLYTLFDLEMVDLAKEILDHSRSDEYMKFRAYLALKESNKHFNIQLFI